MQPALKEIIPYVLSKRSDDPVAHLLAKIEEMRKRKAFNALALRRQELNEKLGKLQDPEEPLIDQADELEEYEALVQRRNEL